VIELAGEGSDYVITSLSTYTLGANVENLIFTGAGNVSGTGNELDNYIVGGSGDDTLIGNDGNDTLVGGAGNDTLTGGAGADYFIGGAGNDVFRFTAASDAVPLTGEVVVDFLIGSDRIDLSAIDADSVAAGNQAFAFIGNAAFGNVAGQLRFDSGILSGDLDGNGTADFAVAVNFNPASTGTLSTADFVL
jgi:Ca2+-binding RTX toxin-like protein